MNKFQKIDKRIGQNLKAMRQVAGLSLQDVADHLDKSYQQIQKYETGFNRISGSVMYYLSRLLEVPIQDFFKDTGTNTKDGRDRGLLELTKAYNEIDLPENKTALRNIARAMADN